MPDFLSKLIEDARNRIRAGYYDSKEDVKHHAISLRQAIQSAEKNAIIAEIKPISPARGPLRPKIDVARASEEVKNGGAIAISVLTEPDNFGGSLENLRQIRAHVNLPLLMKDVIIEGAQILAGKRCGADCVLLIDSVFSRARTGTLSSLIDVAHENQLEVLLEVHNEDELRRAVETRADVVGVNNRDLTTMRIDMDMTAKLLGNLAKRNGKLIVSESGFESPDELRRVKSAGVDGFLIGSAIMLSPDLASKVREFVLA